MEKVKGVIGKEWERKRNTNVSSFKNAKPVLSLIPSHPTSLANVLIPPLSKMDTGSHLHDILLEYESIYSEKQKSSPICTTHTPSIHVWVTLENDRQVGKIHHVTFSLNQILLD